MPSDAFAVVTGTMMRDVVVCERRVWHDVHTDDGSREKVGAFVQLLWAQGVRHEAEALEALDGRRADLRALGPAERRAATLEALADSGTDHVLGAEIAVGDLLGRPDLLSRIDGRWVAGDVKSGSPFMSDGVRPREEYLAQIGLYALILERTGLGDGRRAFVIGPSGARVVFDMAATWSPGLTARALVDGHVAHVRAILAGTAATRGAAAAACGLCHWRAVCRRELDAADDLTLVAELGRRLRPAVEEVAPDRKALAALDLSRVRRSDGRPGLPGIGIGRLSRLRDRARLLTTPGATAYARVPLGLSRAPLELHFDIEADPTSGGPGGFVYLHGIWEVRRAPNGAETAAFHHFFADGPDGEREAFAGAWALLTSDPAGMAYYYSSYERTMYRGLQRRYPTVCTAGEVDAFFASARVVDLYTDVVRPHTEWPLQSYGLKPISKHLGFSWAAEDASGASSIAWYVEYARTGDPGLRGRIVDYNRSDCMAQPVILDALIALPVGVPEWWVPTGGTPTPEAGR